MKENGKITIIVEDLIQYSQLLLYQEESVYSCDWYNI